MTRRSRSGVDRTAEFLNRSLRVHSAVRAALGLVILLGGAFLMLVGAVALLGSLHRSVPYPLGAWMVGLLLLALGCGFIYVGWRLLRGRKGESELFGARAKTIIGLLFGATAVGMMISAWQVDGIMPAVNAVGVGLLSVLIFRSGAVDEDR